MSKPTQEQVMEMYSALYDLEVSKGRKPNYDRATFVKKMLVADADPKLKTWGNMFKAIGAWK